MKMALLFPGQGSQIVGMGKDFIQNFRESKLVFEEAQDSIHKNLLKLCMDGPLEDLTLTENLQPALFTVEMAILAGLKSHTEINPIACAGHSLGESTAIAAAGSLSIREGTRFTHLRGKAMQQAVPVGQGAMAAILGLEAAAVEKLCQKVVESTSEVVEPANLNAPGQIVIAGTTKGVEQACAALKTDLEFKKGKSIPLQVSAPFHCSLMKPAQKLLAPELLKITWKHPCCLIIPNSTAIPTDQESLFPTLLLDQVIKPVLWEQSMRVLKNLGVEIALEIGPGKVLSGLQKRIDKEMIVKNISNLQEMKEAFP